MQLIFRSLNVATFVLMAYLVMSMGQRIPEIHQSISDSSQAVEPLEAKLVEQAEALTLVQAEVEAFRKEVNDRIQAEQALKEKVTLLRGAMGAIEAADRMRAGGDLPGAAERLLSSKDAIWKSGDNFPSEQDTMRGLMGPIDILAGKWRGGDAAAEATEILGQLTGALSRLGF